MSKIWFRNEDCFKTMEAMERNNYKIDLVMTSPPYNMTKRKGGVSDCGRYDLYNDWMSEEEYIDWILNGFNLYDKILNLNGVIIFNLSYSIENPSLPHNVVSNVVKLTNFNLIDTIIWKKKNGLPFPANERRLSRIYEFIFIFARKNEEDTFNCNKNVKSVSEKTGQKYYDVIYNFIEAKNNDGSNNLNKATYSTDLCKKLLSIYAKDGSVVYDPFMGTGTTAIACEELNINCIGSELSEAQVEYSKNRLEEFRKKNGVD